MSQDAYETAPPVVIDQSVAFEAHPGDVLMVAVLAVLLVATVIWQQVE